MPETTAHPESRAAPAGDRPLRVLLWAPHGSGLHYGGPGMTAYRLYATAAPGRFELTLAHGSSHQERYELFSAQHCVRPMVFHPVSQALFLRAADRWMRAHAREFDVVHGLAGFSLTVHPALRAEALGVPAVVKLAAHATDLADKPGLKRILGLPARRRRRLAELSGIIAISHDIADELVGYGLPREKIAEIPNGVDTGQFRPVGSDAERAALRAEHGWRELPTVVFVGGIFDRKRPDLLVEAIALLRDQGVECQLALVGPPKEPEYAERVRALARERDVEPLVTWVAFTENVAPYYRAADVFALPSSSEGLPNAMLEAMASGLPSIGTPISGIRDVIDEDVTGRLVPQEAAPIAAAIRAYLEDPGTRASHGAAARARVEAHYSTARVLDLHEQLFRRIMAGGPAAG